MVARFENRGGGCRQPLGFCAILCLEAGSLPWISKTLLRDCDNICRHGGTDRLGKTKLEKADGTRPAILRTLTIGAKGTGGMSLMIPSIAELRKRLVPFSASDSEANSSKGNPEVSAATARPVPPSFREFLVLRQNLPKFGSRSTSVCRLCRKPPECSIILRPRHLKSRPSEISRWSLEGWLKHDFVFFGESYLCEGCAKAEGFI